MELYTGEWRGGYTELLYLRARFYDLDGRFLTRDTWPGDNTIPISLNVWIYVYANPVNFMDPSGMCADKNYDGLCDFGDEPLDQMYPTDPSIPPNTIGYNEKIPPLHISFHTNTYLNLIHRKLAPLFGKSGKLIARSDAAQFKVRNHEITCTVGVDYKCIPETTINNNWCGQVVLSAVLKLFHPGISTEWVVDRLDKPEGTGYGDISGFVNDRFSQELIAEESIRNDIKTLPMNLRGWISKPALVMPFVNLSNGNTGGGRIGENLENPIAHWVLITGVSNQWNYKDSESAWNWIRIFNPFDNDAEYYWWEDFRKAWFQSTSNYATVILYPKRKEQFHPEYK